MYSTVTIKIQDQNANEVKHFRCNVLSSSNKFPGSARIFGGEMKLVALPVSLFIAFSLAASVVLNFSSAVFLYLLFNILLWVIVLWSYKPSKVEFDVLWPTLQSLCDGEEDPCVMNKVENQSNGNAESSCEVAGDTCFKSENHNNEKDPGNGNAESLCEVAGDTCFKSENHNNEKDQGNGNAESSCEVAGDTCFKSENHNNEKDPGNGNAESLCEVAGDTCFKSENHNNEKDQGNGNAESSCEVAGDTCFKSENHNNEKDQGNGNAESSCDVAGDTYVESKSENHNNEKDRDNGNGKDNDEKYGCSDGCDDDDDGSAGVIGRQDVAEEFDDNLEKRIEDFIAKVNKRWREEKLIEASNKQSTYSSAVVRVSTF
ncbi:TRANSMEMBRANE PROTEIN [Salix purpurea]|uniref:TRANSMEMBRANE PROTEIN n=1 Tax=Salix purpurea TaxID=77065 RepID=A0A9Q0T8X4_SALPP|nr:TRANSMEMBRANE PROTEIN [Salix purpurea]